MVFPPIYLFEKVQCTVNTGKFSDVMISGCWKPLCDYQNYCKFDPNSVYIGQDHHMRKQKKTKKIKFFSLSGAIGLFVCFFSTLVIRHIEIRLDIFLLVGLLLIKQNLMVYVFIH